MPNLKTVGELKEFLKDIPDDMPIAMLSANGVGNPLTGASFTHETKYPLFTYNDNRLPSTLNCLMIRYWEYK